jgi:hypothetical protein
MSLGRHLNTASIINLTLLHAWEAAAPISTGLSLLQTRRPVKMQIHIIPPRLIKHQSRI